MRSSATVPFLAIERKNYAEALKLNDIQLPLAKELDINAYADILAKRATILSKLERWKEAYSYLDQHYELVDSLKEEESTRQLNELNNASSWTSYAPNKNGRKWKVNVSRCIF